jgi:hypothetical protein
MPWKFCPRPKGQIVADLNKQFCYLIPMIIREFPQLPPRPEPPEDPFGHDWVVGRDIKAGVAREVQLLAAIDGLAAHLSAANRSSIQALARRSAEAAGLADFGTLSFGDAHHAD